MWKLPPAPAVAAATNHARRRNLSASPADSPAARTARDTRASSATCAARGGRGRGDRATTACERARWAAAAGGRAAVAGARWWGLSLHFGGRVPLHLGTCASSSFLFSLPSASLLFPPSSVVNPWVPWTCRVFPPLLAVSLALSPPSTRALPGPRGGLTAATTAHPGRTCVGWRAAAWRDRHRAGERDRARR